MNGPIAEETRQEESGGCWKEVGIRGLSHWCGAVSFVALLLLWADAV